MKQVVLYNLTIMKAAEVDEEPEEEELFTGVRAFRSVFDHLRDLAPGKADRLYGKGTMLDPEVNGEGRGGFDGGRASSKAATGPTGGAGVEEGAGAVPWTCRAVVQSLPPLAQHFTMRLLYCDQPVALDDMRAWTEFDKVLSACGASPRSHGRNRLAR